MDRSRSLIALVLALGAVCLACNCEPISSKSYLKFPTDLSIDFHKNIAAALNKIVIESPYASFERFDEAIEEAKKETDSETDRQVYSDLIQLGLGFVDDRLLDIFLSVCAQADNDPNSGLKPWKDYLAHKARQRFSSYLDSMLEYGDWITKGNTDIRVRMDLVFAAAFDMKGDIRDQQDELARKLSGFDPATDKAFNAKNMIREIRRVTHNKSTGDDFDLFKNYMLDCCKRFMAHKELKKVIIQTDLLRCAKGAINTDYVALKLMDEYNRICLALETPDTSDLIMDNLNKLLKRNWLGF